MKQGRATSSGPGSQKPTTVVHPINPGGVSQFGEAIGNHVTDKGNTGYHGDRVRMGSSFTAPRDKSCVVHHGGSQGKH